MQNKKLNNIQKKINDPDLMDKLVRQLSFSELQSLLMNVFDEKRKTIRANDIMDQYRNDPFLYPSGVDQRIQISFDSIINGVLPEEYHVIELSPVSPLGSCSQIADISQNKIISTVRKNEVCSDPTNMLALEASLRRKGSNNTVRLATSHRVLRTERIVTKDSVAHFRVFAMCIAGRDKGNYKFESEALKELLLLYLQILHELHEHGYNFSKIRINVKYRDRSVMEAFDMDKLNSQINKEKTILSFETDKDANWNYYGNLRFQILISDNKNEFFIVDGGDADWTRKILNNKKERFFISGFGSERFMMLFKT